MDISTVFSLDTGRTGCKSSKSTQSINFCCVYSTCQHLKSFLLHKRFDFFHVIVSVFNVKKMSNQQGLAVVLYTTEIYKMLQGTRFDIKLNIFCQFTHRNREESNNKHAQITTDEIRKDLRIQTFVNLLWRSINPYETGKKRWPNVYNEGRTILMCVINTVLHWQSFRAIQSGA